MGKKAIILVMSCNKDRFIKEENAIRETYAKDILENKYSNIKLIFYRGGSEESYYDETINTYFSKERDDLDGTYHKTIDVFKWVSETFDDFDYIIRTNTTTYINIDAIRQFLELKDDYNGFIIGPDLLIIGVNNWVPTIRGHFQIYSKSVIVDLIANPIEIECGIDDIVIGFMLHKIYDSKYLERILAIDGEHLENNFKANNKLYCVKVRGTENDDYNVLNMYGVHFLFKNIKNKTPISKPHGFKNIETTYGKIPI
jgi:hypothetical protein